MIYYLNRGFIAEQAIADIIHRYIHQLKLDEVYGNFHITITNDHPFAHLILHQDAANTADEFPSIVITTQQENKVPELMNLPPDVSAVSLTSEDIDAICSNKREKKVIDETTGEEKTVTKKGETVYETIPGYCVVTDENTVQTLKDLADSQGAVYGVNYVTRRRDHVSIEIWAENNQLKNELYEQLRLYIVSAFYDILRKNYKSFDPVILDSSLNGERSNNFNFDFDVPLYGAHLSFELDYCIGQILIDTEIETLNKDLVWEVINHVKDN